MERHHGSSQRKAAYAKRPLVHHEYIAKMCILTRSSAVAVASNTNDAESILNVKSDVEHSRMRRVLAHAFSEKAVREQEPLIQKYVDLLMSSLHEAAEEGPQNMVSWYELVAFDIIGMLKIILS